MKYPPTRRADVVDSLHGESIPDPYRWLEDADGAEVREWTAAQNAVTFAYLDRIRPGTHRLETPVGIVEAQLFENGEVEIARLARFNRRQVLKSDDWMDSALPF